MAIKQQVSVPPVICVSVTPQLPGMFSESMFVAPLVGLFIILILILCTSCCAQKMSQEVSLGKGRFQKKKKKKLMEFSIKGPDPASQHLNGKKIK